MPTEIKSARDALEKCYEIALQWEADELAGVAGTTDKPEARSASEALLEIERLCKSALAILVRVQGAKVGRSGRSRQMTIAFSHQYPKLHGQTSAELLAVRPIRIDRLTCDELLEYDTTYYEQANDFGQNYSMKRRYPLKTGNYIQLIFLGNYRIPFCTIRSAYPPSKVEYYKSSVGKIFSIEIRGADKGHP